MNVSRRVLAVACLALMGGVGWLAGANRFGKPKSVLHVVTVRWKPDSTEAQRDAAIKGLEQLAGGVPGIKNIWTKTLKVQGDNYNNAFVIEFESEAAFKAYDDAPAHKDWEKLYLPVRDRSTTHDITN